MNPALVADASVVVKLLLEEEFSNNARLLFQTSEDLGRPILAPPFLPTEVTNAVYQRFRRHEINQKELNTILNYLDNLGIEIFTPSGLYLHAAELAIHYNLKNIYDAVYLSLAELANVEIWTDDRALLRSIGKNLPWLRWIKDFTG